MNTPEPEAPLPAKLGVSRTRGSTLLIGARALNALFNLISVPIFLSVLGKEGYGAIVFALVVHGLMSLSDIGTGEVVQRQMSLAIAKNDQDEIRELNRDQLSLNLLTGALMLLVGIVLGLTLSLETEGVGRNETFFIFAALGLQSGIYRINQSTSTLLASHQRFDSISIAFALGGLTVTGVAVAAVYATGRPWAYMAAMLVAEGAIFLVLRASARRMGHGAVPRPALRWLRLRPILQLCAADYPNRAAAYFSTWGDKLMLGAANLRVSLVDYRNAARLPDALRDMLTPLAATSLPSLSRDFQRSPGHFRANVLRSGLTVYFAATLAMVAPSGFADPFLRLWLGDMAPRDGAAVMALMSVFQSLQLYLAVMGASFFAAAKRAWFIPITVSGAAAALFLTLPFYRAYGILGVASMNAGLGILQAVGLWFLLLRLGFPGREIAAHAARALAVLAVCLAFVAGGWAVSRTHLLGEFPVLCLVFAPIAILGAGASVLGLRIARLPEAVAKRLGRRKAGPNDAPPP
jgi:O-antigen/teichoic acid export membrane protein